MTIKKTRYYVLERNARQFGDFFIHNCEVVNMPPGCPSNEQTAETIFFLMNEATRSMIIKYLIYNSSFLWNKHNFDSNFGALEKRCGTCTQT